MRRVGIAEGELLVRSFVVPHLAGKGDHIGCIEAVLRVVQRELRDAGMIGMRRDVAVGNAAGHPYDALVHVLAIDDAAALADHLEDPRLVLVHDRERFAAGGIAVGVGQFDDRCDRLAGRSRPLERDIDQRTVVDAAVGINQFGPAAVGGFGNDQLTVIHVADRRIGMRHLQDLAQIAARIPFVDRHQIAGLVVLLRGIVLVEGTVEDVRIGRVRHHGRAVGRSALRDDEIGTGLGHADPERGEQSGC